MKYRMLATSLFGLESVTAREIKQLGFENVETRDGRVLFDADENGVALANYRLRTAERVFLVVGEFRAADFDALHEAIKALPWEIYLERDSAFPVSAVSTKSRLFAVPSIQSVAKAAIVAKLRTIYRTEIFSESGAVRRIQIHLLRDTVSVLVDTSGSGLHKRGYRAYGNKAPLKETLAAGLLSLANWHPEIPLIDPMCGSGTILIEAALMRRGFAPGRNRSFDFELWSRFDTSEIRSLRAQIRRGGLPEEPRSPRRLEGYDADEASIRQARINARKAGVEDDIHFQVRALADFSTKEKYGSIITNPPYGERMADRDQAAELYREMGRIFAGYPRWSKYIITAHEDFESLYGLKATKKRKLYNGMIKCFYYQYFGERTAGRERE